jgi:aminoglycoside phosphotransferase (APT) family kinase protein
MKIIASGRDGDIFEFAPGLVLRKARNGRSIAHEARTMRYVAEHGYPVPRIEEVRAGGTEIVMERIDGPIMMDAMVRPPWGLGDHLRLLADLHDRLHQIPAPDWLPGMPDGGDRLLHLDLHPLNVIMAPGGPVVIDWPNARRGEPMVDVAVTYALMLSGHIPLPRPVAAAMNAVRTPIVRRWFAKRYVGPDFYRRVAEMAELKCFDPNMAPDEVRALRRLAARSAARAPG